MQAKKLNASRRDVLRGLAGALLSATAPLSYTKNAWSADKTINVGTYKGPQADYIRKQVIPAFEKQYGCKVNQSEGSTLDQIAILRIQRSAPTFSVMFMDDVGVPIARAENLIDALPLSKMPNSAKVNKRYLVNDAHGIAFCMSTAAPFYNTDSVKPLTSYADLWTSDFKDSFMMVTPSQTQGVFLPVIAAALATGLPVLQAQYQLDKGWDKLAALRPSVQTIYSAGVTSVLQVSQGQAKAGGLELSKVVLPYTAKGASVNQCYPKEGVFGVLGCMTAVKNGANPDLAAAFMDRMLDSGVQKGLAEASFAAPTVDGVTLSPQAAKLMNYSASGTDEHPLALLDWAFINSRRGQIIDKVNQIFGVRS